MVDIIDRNDNCTCGRRPCIIVQNDIGNEFSPTTIVVPLTTKLKKLEMKTHVLLINPLHEDINSMALCEQVLTVSKSNIVGYVGELNENDMMRVSVGLMCSLGILM